jgi:hypothetical protein
MRVSRAGKRRRVQKHLELAPLVARLRRRGKVETKISEFFLVCLGVPSTTPEAVFVWEGTFEPLNVHEAWEEKLRKVWGSVGAFD